jgi:tRNA U34 5-methylaminomethyl-2-thiouridine-forming methyltransferase MnmC
MVEKNNLLSVIKTDDGSQSLYSLEYNEPFHSTYGAVTESKHVFIEAGLHAMKNHSQPIIILEVGFGTGLNAFLSYLYSRDHSISIDYTGIEPQPIGPLLAKSLSYPEYLQEVCEEERFLMMHRPGADQMQLSDLFHFSLKKIRFQETLLSGSCNLVFWDAFAPDADPWLWRQENFQKTFEYLAKGGILVTYSAKGTIRRMLEAIGFQTERLQGPPGKREMLRATKP